MVVAVFQAESGESFDALNNRLRSKTTYSGCESKMVMKFVWSFEKFRNRLQAMRDFYEECQKLGVAEKMQQLAREPYSDPWKEIGGGEVEMLVDGLTPGCDRNNQNGIGTTTAGGSSGSSDVDSVTSQEESDVLMVAGTGGSADRMRRITEPDAALSREIVNAFFDGDVQADAWRGSRSCDLGELEARSCDLGEWSRGAKGKKTKDLWYEMGRRRGQQLFRRTCAATIEDTGDGVRPRAQTVGGLAAFRSERQRPSAQSLASVASPTTAPGIRLDRSESNKSIPGDLEMSGRLRTWTSELQANEAEKKTKMKNWSSQIEAKASLLLQLKENLSQLRALDTSLSLPKGLSPQSKTSSPSSGFSPASFPPKRGSINDSTSSLRMGQLPLQTSGARTSSPKGADSASGASPFFQSSSRGAKVTRFTGDRAARQGRPSEF